MVVACLSHLGKKQKPENACGNNTQTGYVLWITGPVEWDAILSAVNGFYRVCSHVPHSGFKSQSGTGTRPTCPSEEKLPESDT